LRETGSIPAAPPATNRATNPRQHRPKDLNKPRRDIHLVKINYCEDTRPQNHLNAAKDQHKDLCDILRGASVTLHIILLGVGGTIYNTHTLKPFKELGLDSQRVKKLTSKQAALCVSCVSCVPSCYLRASLHASSCMLHAPCLVPCALLCLSLLIVSFVLSSAPLHFVFLALLVSRGSLSLSHAH